ncbi:endonuclease/exonuclease/phosphatase family protein [Parabacteroides distasonis]|uniref:endonuclease/exonuclease/phosphatase family protein n=1 Tax=Parabacteroides distasonis TaxID=823 RepID=UPI00325BD63D
MFNTHFSLDKESRIESIKVINQIATEYDKPIIITGDFNMTPGSNEFEAMKSKWQLLSDPSIKTYPADRPRLRLDYIYGDMKKNFKVTKDVVVDVMSSDHLPLYIDVEF